MAPGPDNIFVLAHSALHGRKSGWLVTLGLCTGLVVHTSGVALGLAALLQTSAIAFTLIKTIGALYLLYLAWQAFSNAHAHLSGSHAKLSSQQLYRRGIVMNLTNPKVTLFFLAFLPQFVDQNQVHVSMQLFMLGGMFILITLIVFGTIAYLAGTLGRWLDQSPKIQSRLNGLAGWVFLGLAIKLMVGSVDA
jgi:threonine/homoserine/homoserine lactone efflux protein